MTLHKSSPYKRPRQTTSASNVTAEDLQPSWQPNSNIQRVHYIVKLGSWGDKPQFNHTLIGLSFIKCTYVKSCLPYGTRKSISQNCTATFSAHHILCISFCFMYLLHQLGKRLNKTDLSENTFRVAWENTQTLQFVFQRFVRCLTSTY